MVTVQHVCYVMVLDKAVYTHVTLGELVSSAFDTLGVADIRGVCPIPTLHPHVHVPASSHLQHLYANTNSHAPIALHC